ncbi:MAG: hypothetical protein E7070_09310 [Bacteroidales bacterium]|jgi:hypothetical protein|nr:hypothetical protein [Bacteroidales bacterium]
MIKFLKNTFIMLAVGLMGLTACKDDDSVDYTQYYDWRDQNSQLTVNLLSDIRELGNAAYFTDSIPSISEPYAYFTVAHIIESANEDSLRSVHRWFTPFYNSTLKVHYTLYNSDTVMARFEEYDVLDDQSKRNDAELMNKIFGIGYAKGMDGYEVKADTLESYQVKFYEGFTCSSVIRGWQDCLQRMHIGDNWLIMVPWYLAYGQSGSGSIGPYSNLYFRLKLVDITYWGGNVDETD